MQLTSNEVVIVTGASRGIGRETALAFAKKGCSIAILSRDEKLLNETKNAIEALGSKVLAIVCDVSDERACYASIEKVIQTFGKVDVLVNNAGYGHYSSIENIETKSLEDIFRTNVFGSFWCIKAVLPGMKKNRRGHIVNISSVIGKRAFPYMGAYCMSKFALAAMDESLGLELAGTGVNVSLVCPGYTATDFQKNAKLDGPRPNLRQKLGMKPAAVGKAIVKAVEKNKRRTILTFDGKLLLWMNKISPTFVDEVLKRYFGKERTA